MTDLIKTALSLKTAIATYPIYYYQITERYFIKRLGRFDEVRREDKKWTRTDVKIEVRERLS